MACSTTTAAAAATATASPSAQRLSSRRASSSSSSSSSSSVARANFRRLAHHHHGVRCDAATSSSPTAGEYCREYRLDLQRPMGMVLNSGRKETGAYVAGLVEGGNAEADGSIAVEDVITNVGPDGTDITNMLFDDIMDLLAENPDEPTMSLTMKRFANSPNKSTPEGYVWLEGNAKKEGVVVLPSGLQYKVLETGKGPAGIKTDTPCSCHYEGTLLDGTVFDSSYKRGKPITFAPRQVIKGWTEAMQLMREGDKWELYVPAELGYGGRGSPSGSIKPGDTLIFTIEIVQVNP